MLLVFLCVQMAWHPDTLPTHSSLRTHACTPSAAPVPKCTSCFLNSSVTLAVSKWEQSEQRNKLHLNLHYRPSLACKKRERERERQRERETWVIFNRDSPKICICNNTNKDLILSGTTMFPSVTTEFRCISYGHFSLLHA